MDQDLYDLMMEILAEKRSDFTKDIEFVGTVTTTERDSSGNSAQITHDIFKIIDEMPDGSIVKKLYNENKEYLAAYKSFAGHENDDILLHADSAIIEDSDFMDQLFAKAQHKGFSLDEFHTQIAKLTGMDKEEIKEIGFSSLAAEIDDNGKKKDEDELTLDEETLNEDSKSTGNQSTQDILNKSAKVEQIDLNQKFDDRYHLYDILGVPAGTVLVTAHSDSFIETGDSKKDHTKYGNAFLYPDGTLHSSENKLELVGGEYSNRNINVVKRDGEVEEIYYPSTWRILTDDPRFQHKILASRLDDAGRFETVLGNEDVTDNKQVIAKQLETVRSFPEPEQTEIRYFFDEDKNDKYRTTRQIDEIEEHKGHGCENLGMLEANGNLNDGHLHGEQAAELIMADKDFVDSIHDTLDNEMVAERFEKIAAENRGRDNASLIEMTKWSLKADDQNRDKNHSDEERDDTDFMPSHNHPGE